MASAPASPAPLRFRRRRPWREVGDALEGFLARFPAASRLEADPVRIARRYAAAEDREVAALVASCLAFGRASSLIEKAERALLPFGDRPARALARLGDGEVPPHLERWVHRWVRGRDLAWLLAGIGRIVREDGSVGACFRTSLAREESGRDLLAPMAAFARRVTRHDASPWSGSGRPTRGMRHLLPVPDGRAAGKRLCLFLRWMVRREDGVDLGLWTDAGPERLTIPLDTHVARIGSYLGLTERRTPGWAMAREITDNLARFAPTDPTRYDFALSHLGIMGGCPRRRDARKCAACDLLPACRL